MTIYNDISSVLFYFIQVNFDTYGKVPNMYFLFESYICKNSIYIKILKLDTKIIWKSDSDFEAESCLFNFCKTLS